MAEAAVQAESSSRSSSVVYESEEETTKDYRPGGYHPVHLNDLFLNRYIIKQKLGWGHFSTVWLCLDTKHDTYVAMKIQKSAENYTEAAYDEIDILLKVAGNYKAQGWVESLRQYYSGKEDQKALENPNSAASYTFVVQFLHSFVHVGENGKHVCMVFEILGVNLLEIIKRFQYKGIPIPICRVISKQVLVGLDYLHRICGIIHTDLKPENVLLELTQEQIKAILTTGHQEKTPTFLETPAIELVQEMFLTEIDRKEAIKKEKKREKKKRYKLRKKEAKKMMKENGFSEVENCENKKKENGHQLKVPETTIKTDADLSPKRIISVPLASTSPIDESIRVKIADLGNACWLDTHFSTEIQTRQYRSPEVILGVSYTYTADVWSFACMMFELVTGDFLFEPKSGSDFDKDDDHLGQMIETLGEMPKSFALSGINSKKFFTKAGKLRKIHQLRYWSIKEVLLEKYHMKETEAAAFADFLGPMLVYQPEQRATAQQVLRHPWLNMPAVYDCKMTDEEIVQFEAHQTEEIQRKTDQVDRGVITDSSPELSRRSEAEDHDADDEFSDLASDSAASEEPSKAFDEVESHEYHQKMHNLRATLVDSWKSEATIN